MGPRITRRAWISKVGWYGTGRQGKWRVVMGRVCHCKAPRSRYGRSVISADVASQDLILIFPAQIQRLFILQDQFVCSLELGKPFEPNGSYPPSDHAQGFCRSPRDIDDATFPKRSAIIDPHVYGFSIV